jgi:hypothetical protein
VDEIAAQKIAQDIAVKEITAPEISLQKVAVEERRFSAA